MEITMGMWLGLVLGALPLVGWLLWWWNELWYVVPLKTRWCAAAGSAEPPPGHMGFPFFGEMITFLWYFKFLRRPNDFINSKRRKYGDGVGMYRSHLFGSPCIIACSASANKFVFKSDDAFIIYWPTAELLGSTALVTVHGKAHERIRNYLTNAINRSDALRGIALLVQPRIVAALQSWAQKGKIRAFDATKKVTLENIGKMFAGLEPGPVLDSVDQLFAGLMKGLRAQPYNFPGTAYHHGLQCRKKLDEIFRVELQKRKKNENGEEAMNDLMDGLRQLKDDEGNQLRDQEVVDNIVSLVVGGYLSTALASMWAIYFLAKFPDVLKKLREESMAVSENKKGDFITSDDISKMKYTNKVVEETIRMANIAPFIFRVATRDVEYEGFKIPKGWKIILWLRYLHTDPENFEDPMCFNPDRWNQPARPGAFQVFGGGSRQCVGNMLARTQLAIFLHHLAAGYKWELLNPDAEMRYLPHPIPVDGVEVAFTKI